MPLVTAGLTLCGIAYSLLALWGLGRFRRSARGLPESGASAPGVSILKPLRGTDPRQYLGFESHCRQRYAGPFEIVFGVGSVEDPAVAAVGRLRVEFPEVAIRLIECRERLGTNGKVSTLMQMLPEARYQHVIVNDSDILVGPEYLARVMGAFGTEAVAGERPLGLVTVPYVGQAEGTSPVADGGFGGVDGLYSGGAGGSRAGGWIAVWAGFDSGYDEECSGGDWGFGSLVDQLADDYELGSGFIGRGTGWSWCRRLSRRACRRTHGGGS